MHAPNPFRLLCALLGCLSLTAAAQDIGQLGVKKGVTLNGSLNLSTIGYRVWGLEQRRDPFNWFATGNLNVNLFGYSVPLSFSYSNANTSFSQPFNQFTFTPQYKWLKTYVGYSAMTFSNYTLNGHVFLGGGVELTPGNWRISAMYGRLRKAVPYDLTDSLQNTQASYKRMGYGVKVGYDHNGDNIGMSVFTAKDDVNSLPFTLQEYPLAPQQNIAVSLTGRKKFLQRFFVEGEYAISALNNDIRANTAEADSVPRKASNLINGLLPQNSTQRYFDAVNAGLGYQGNWFTLQLRYERVAPEYQTLGAYFFNNDLRNITIAPMFRLLKGRLNMAANVGLQQNNLDEARESTSKRTVGSLNITFAPSEKWNFTTAYSNFTSFTNQRPLPDPLFNNQLDTLNFYQVSETFTGSTIRMLGGQKNPQTIMLTGSYQQASNKATFQPQAELSDFLSLNVAYSYAYTPSNLTLAIAGNYYTNNAVGIQSSFWGPTLSATKAFFDKTLRCSLSSSYNQTSGNNIRSGPVLNNRLNLTYAPKTGSSQTQRHNFSLGVSALRRFAGTETQPAFTELTGTFNYSYSF